MDLIPKIKQAFGWRPMPVEVVEGTSLLQLDSDVEEALWFAGRNWRDITWQDWQQRRVALTFMSPDAFTYYLPSVLILSLKNPEETLAPAQSSIWNLDRTPSIQALDRYLIDRFRELRTEEYEVLKEWLLQLSDYVPYRGFGIAASGPGDVFGRAFDTLNLLQTETRQRHP
ncbi:MAG: hypothetical protein JO300_01390 [Silvibacterium sp.]|nr:hypothetical protein [Silvibacterium sp.]